AEQREKPRTDRVGALAAKPERTSRRKDEREARRAYNLQQHERGQVERKLGDGAARRKEVGQSAKLLGHEDRSEEKHGRHREAAEQQPPSREHRGLLSGFAGGFARPVSFESIADGFEPPPKFLATIENERKKYRHQRRQNLGEEPARVGVDVGEGLAAPRQYQR